MIINEDFLNKLRRAFGLNLYEVKLWTALLSRGVSSAGELSDIADVPRSRTYEVLDRVRKRVTETTEDRLKRLSELKESDVIKELAQLYKQGVEPLQPTDFGGALKGRHNLYDHLAYLIKEAQSH